MVEIGSIQLRTSRVSTPIIKGLTKNKEAKIQEYYYVGVLEEGGNTSDVQEVFQ